MSILTQLQADGNAILEKTFAESKVESGDSTTVSKVSPSVVTDVDAAIAALNVDLNKYNVRTASFSSYQQGSKVADEYVANTLHAYKIVLDRKTPAPIEIAVKSIIDNWSPKVNAVKQKKLKTTPASPLSLLEISLYDAHFGKKCVDGVDLARISEDYVTALEGLLDNVSTQAIDKIVIPIGHDFFQVDNWIGTTTKGTVVDVGEEHFTEVFRCGWQTLEKIISLCAEIAPVECVWVPGNHDKQTSWYLCELLRARFQLSHPNVTFDLGLGTRKYKAWKQYLFGYTHGNQVRHRDLPLLMATESGLWQAERGQIRQWRTGHFHKKSETRFNVADTYNGVSVCVLPSLSGTDEWHDEHGWPSTDRMAEATIWKDNGDTLVLTKRFN